MFQCRERTLPVEMVSIRDLGILADDLSGACNVASCFVHNCSAISVRVNLDLPGAGSEGLEVINTQSRTLSAEGCKAAARQAGRSMRDKPVVFKKIDSALRGCVGAEIEGLIEAIGERQVVIAPAIPSIGRITAGGVQYDRGAPIEQTAYADDPISPTRSSRVLDIIRTTGNVECRVFDARSDEDLDGVVDRALAEHRLLLVGSLGLARALARRLPKAGGPRLATNGSGTVWIICGSMYEQAHRQIDIAAKRFHVPVVEVDPYAPQRMQYGELEGLSEVICRIGISPRPSEGRAPNDIVTGFITRITPLLESMKPHGVGIVGGDTAFELMMGCGIRSLEVAGSIAEVIACGRIRDGSLAGCSFAVKGGSVGDDDAVVEMVAYLKKDAAGDG